MNLCAAYLLSWPMMLSLSSTMMHSSRYMRSSWVPDPSHVAGADIARSEDEKARRRRRRWREGDDDDDEGEGEDDDGEEDEKPSTSSASSVVPIDFVVPPRTSLVAITGPNTGGKTASLKLLGLCLLMARAGLHLPVARGAAGADARVPWTKTVLADLGDAQSLDLEGGLSTFSAHLRRLQRILRASRDDTDAKRYTVVLLDEPGGGTDPAEGAALASAVLRASADACRLVVATSHYDEVKALAGGDGGDGGMVGAANAAVEFDAATLRPTYRLLWGASGESNALAIARGLGLDAGVADRAEKRWRRQRRAAGLRGDDDDGAGAGMRSAGFVLDTPDQYFGASFSEFDR
uniref:DNA mismatch repair proteins mutS family domain-containing protein n=1 Tax=Micromonas pusilla TaxID=38833 RepID=A0A7R9TWJ0_MICPS|mmetsp:Transcript_8393/g.30705  ORF Transcript_8393/g.30705 Transcript_8393/m.30705 type:complete len:349 (+) Transcript_8393:1656-2702(+)